MQGRRLPVLGPHRLSLACLALPEKRLPLGKKTSLFGGLCGLSISARGESSFPSSHVLHGTGKVLDVGGTATQSGAGIASAPCTGVLEEQPLLFQLWDT